MSLTELQIQKLTPLLAHPKYGKILFDACEQWKLENIYQMKTMFGLLTDLKLKQYYFADNCGCLLGAALVGKDYSKIKNSNLSLTTKSLAEIANNIFSISKKEFNDLIAGFDGIETIEESEAYLFAKNVNEILFNNQTQENS